MRPIELQLPQAVGVQPQPLPTFLNTIAGCPWCRAPLAPAGAVGTTLPCPACARTTTLRPEPTRWVWDAVGPVRAPRTLAQLSNVVWPTPRLYERLWRVRSLSLLSGRKFPVNEELGELSDALARFPERGVVVDVGCSEGLYGRHLASDGWQVVAVDHSVPFLASVARRSALQPDLADRIALVRATAQALPLRDQSVDAVVIGGSLNEIGDAGAAVREGGRVLRPGGVLFSMHLVEAHTRRGRLLQRTLGGTGIRPYGERATRELLGAAFTVESFAVDGVVARLVAIRSDEPSAAESAVPH